MNPTEATAYSPLTPQLIRYGVTIVGSIVTGAGLATDSEVQTIAGALAAILPPLYRIITTILARRKVG